MQRRFFIINNKTSFLESFDRQKADNKLCNPYWTPKPQPSLSLARWCASGIVLLSFLFQGFSATCEPGVCPLTFLGPHRVPLKGSFKKGTFL